MLTTRILPPSDWHLLEGTESAPFAHAPEDAAIHPLVIEDDGVVVGTWTLGVYHVVEGLWIHPDYRQRIGVARSIVRGMRQHAGELGVTQALTFALSKDIARMLRTFGAKPMTCGEKVAVPYIVPFVKEIR